MVLKPVRGCLFLKWLHIGLHDDAAQLECHSCERFLSRADIRHYMYKPSVSGYVLTELKNPIGYILCQRSRRSKEEIELINLVVHSDYRRKGVGSLLLDRVKQKRNWNKIVAHIRESNLGGHLFLKSYGFTATGVVKDYFQDECVDCVEKEDAYRFELLKERAENA